jgi:hypothetical protein
MVSDVLGRRRDVADDLRLFKTIVFLSQNRIADGTELVVKKGAEDEDDVFEDETAVALASLNLVSGAVRSELIVALKRSTALSQIEYSRIYLLKPDVVYRMLRIARGFSTKCNREYFTCDLEDPRGHLLRVFMPKPYHVIASALLGELAPPLSCTVIPDIANNTGVIKVIS